MFLQNGSVAHCKLSPLLWAMLQLAKSLIVLRCFSKCHVIGLLICVGHLYIYIWMIKGTGPFVLIMIWIEMPICQPVQYSVEWLLHGLIEVNIFVSGSIAVSMCVCAHAMVLCGVYFCLLAFDCICRESTHKGVKLMLERCHTNMGTHIFVVFVWHLLSAN